MKLSFCLFRTIPLLAAASSIAWVAAPGAAADWPAWRGDLAGSGVSPETHLPREWSREKNIRWRVDLPDRGNSTPVVLGNRIFVTQAVEAEHFRGLFCFDRKDGKLLWKKGVTYAPAEQTHRSNPYCSASPATDGRMVVASYGSAGVAAYDLEGNELWKRDFGPVDHIWGNATSPLLLSGNLCLHYHGPGKGAFLAGLDKRTGETIWKFDEPEWQVTERTDGFREKPQGGVIGSWSTPILVPAGDREELIMSFPLQVMALNPATGKVLWTCEGLNPLVYGSPVHQDGIVVVLGGYYGNSLGVKTGGSGDVTGTHRLWHQVRHNGGIGTGVVKNGHYYYLAGPMAQCIEMATGKLLWEARLPGKANSWGSFVLAGDWIYTLSQKGETVVFKADPAGLQVGGQGDVGEETNSSLAVSGGELFLRTYKSLWCIGSPST